MLACAPDELMAATPTHLSVWHGSRASRHRALPLLTSLADVKVRARTAYRPAGRNAAHDGHACAPRQARSEARSQRRSAVLKGQRPPASCSAQLDETIYASSMSASVRVVIICRVATVWRVVFLRSRVRACGCVHVYLYATRSPH